MKPRKQNIIGIQSSSWQCLKKNWTRRQYLGHKRRKVLTKNVVLVGWLLFTSITLHGHWPLVNQINLKAICWISEGIILSGGETSIRVEKWIVSRLASTQRPPVAASSWAQLAHIRGWWTQTVSLRLHISNICIDHMSVQLCLCQPGLITIARSQGDMYMYVCILWQKSDILSCRWRSCFPSELSTKGAKRGVINLPMRPVPSHKIHLCPAGRRPAWA